MLLITWQLVSFQSGCKRRKQYSTEEGYCTCTVWSVCHRKAHYYQQGWECVYMYTYCLQLQFQSPCLFLCFGQLGLNWMTEQSKKSYRYTIQKVKNDFLSLSHWYTVLTETEPASRTEAGAGATTYYPKCAVPSLCLLNFVPVVPTMPLCIASAVLSVFSADMGQFLH